MHKYIVYIALSVAVFSCKSKEENTETTEKVQTEKPEDLVNIENGVFTEYYPGKKKIKFQGSQDELQQRHGRWTYYSEQGVELSITYFDHGKKHGHTIVKYPNGALHYVGEYDHDKEIGIWQTYDPKGVKTITDYSKINK